MIEREYEDGIFQSLLNREALETTGIGNGIAVPHARRESVGRLVGATGLSRQGIEFLRSFFSWSRLWGRSSAFLTTCAIGINSRVIRKNLREQIGILLAHAKGDGSTLRTIALL